MHRETDRNSKMHQKKKKKKEKKNNPRTSKNVPVHGAEVFCNPARQKTEQSRKSTDLHYKQYLTKTAMAEKYRKENEMDNQKKIAFIDLLVKCLL